MSEDSGAGHSGAGHSGAGDIGAETRALCAAHGERMLALARRSVELGVRGGRQAQVDDADLAGPGACFVTLYRRGALRGCIGSIEPRRPLAQDIWANAHAAAFEDPRFPPMTVPELDGLSVSISVLGPLSPMRFADELDLRSQLQPGVDGLLIGDQGRRAIYLPSVWEVLPRVEDFVGQLKRKAGLSADHWSATFEAWRYVTVKVGGD